VARKGGREWVGETNSVLGGVGSPVRGYLRAYKRGERLSPNRAGWKRGGKGRKNEKAGTNIVPVCSGS